MIATLHTPADILNNLCIHFNIKPSEVNTIGATSIEKEIDYQFVVQAYIYCLWRFTNLSILHIGIETGRTSGFIAGTIANIQARCKVDNVYRAKIIKVEEIFE